MTTRIRRVVTAIDADGKTFSEVHSEVQAGERWFPLDPVSLVDAGPDAKAWQDQYGATQSEEIGTLTAERDQLKSELDTANSTIETLQPQVDTIPGLQSEFARLTSELSTATTSLTEAESARDAALSQVETLQPLADSVPGLQAEIERLTALIPPPLPERSIYPRELLGRLTRAEVIAALRSDDDDVIFAVANLQTTVSPVLLDADGTRLLIGSLVVAGIITSERMAEVLS